MRYRKAGSEFWEHVHVDCCVKKKHWKEITESVSKKDLLKFVPSGTLCETFADMRVHVPLLKRCNINIGLDSSPLRHAFSSMFLQQLLLYLNTVELAFAGYQDHPAISS